MHLILHFSGASERDGTHDLRDSEPRVNQRNLRVRSGFRSLRFLVVTFGSGPVSGAGRASPGPPAAHPAYPGSRVRTARVRRTVSHWSFRDLIPRLRVRPPRCSSCRR